MSENNAEILARMLGLDAFEMIAFSDIMGDLEGWEWPPAPGSLHERKLMELGALVMRGEPLEDFVARLDESDTKGE